MRATIRIEVKNRKERDAIVRGLSDPSTRASVIVAGLLLPLTTGEQRRILNYVADKLAEETK